MRQRLLRFLLVFVVLALTLGARAQCPTQSSTNTPNINLILPSLHQPNWNLCLNSNFTLIDTFAGSTLLKAPTATQAVTNPAFTYTTFNSAQLFGALPTLSFGVSSGVPTGHLTETAAGVYTLDTANSGDALGSLHLAALNAGTLNAATRFTFAGAAPLNHLLLGNGASYVDVASIPYSVISGGPPVTIYYQTVAAGGTSQTQRARLNLIGTGATTVACVDNPGTNSTDCSVSVSTGGTPRTCNANGCYTIAPDGTIDAWGRTTSPSGSASAQALVATFPTSFTTLTNLEMVVSPTGSPGGDGNPHPLDCHVDTLSTSGAVVVMAIAQQITGSGYNSPLLSTQYCSWHAIGH